MLTLLKIVLGPLLLLQGRRVRKTALRLPEAMGPRSGIAGSATGKPPLRLLFIGDSSAAGVGVDVQERALAPQAAAYLSQMTGIPVKWQLVARSGVNTQEALQMVTDASLDPADVVIAALGVNDVTTQRSPRQFMLDYNSLAEHVLARVGARCAVVTGLPPMHILPAAPQPLRWYLGRCARQLDTRLRDWASAKSNFAYISLQWAAVPRDMARDGFHPGPGQYRHWAQMVAVACAQMIESPGIDPADAIDIPSAR